LPNCASEDVGELISYGKGEKGAFFFLGTYQEEVNGNKPLQLHQSEMDYNDNATVIGINSFIGIIKDNL